jgi:hypothetical protein
MNESIPNATRAIERAAAPAPTAIAPSAKFQATVAAASQAPALRRLVRDERMLTTSVTELDTLGKVLNAMDRNHSSASNCHAHPAAPNIAHTYTPDNLPE